MDQYIDDNSSFADQDSQALPVLEPYNNRASVIQQIGDTTFPFEVSELIYKSFERTTDNRHARASYYKGAPLREVHPTALQPTVSIVFLPGPDRMAVAALEQKQMTKEQPNQKSPSWRVLTAGTLLSNIEVSDELHVTHSDCTPDVAASIRQRLARESAASGSQTALVLRKGDDRVLTVDSDNVKIVSELSPEPADIEATLIEVDKFSLSNLLSNFRQVLSTDAKNYHELLEVMMEDARRLAIRSPVLFRTSTRQRICGSKNTRYGVDHGTMFETIATSTAIKNVILKSDACFDSLAHPGAQGDQDLVRPRFLQMLTLFLSLLNDDDLRSIAMFLEKTYTIKPDRSSIELLILKVLPLASINSSIFVREMFSAVEQNRCPRLPEKEVDVWNMFVSRLVSNGYALPGFTEQMGQMDKSWLVKFPTDTGFKDSYVFNNLQCCGETSSTINQIPSIDLGTENVSKEVSVVLTNGGRYLIDNADNQKIIGMIFGNYSLTEAEGNRRTFDLSINEEAINQDLVRAIQQTNTVLRIVNSFVASLKLRGKIVKWIANGLETLNLPRPENSFVTYEEVRSCGRLTWHEARLGRQILAVAYKVEGRKVHRRDLIRNLAADLRSVRSTVMCIEHELDHFKGRRVSDDARQTMASVRDSLAEIRQSLGLAEQKKQRLERIISDVSDEPIKQTIYPGSISERSVATYWSPYRAGLHENSLQVDCRRDHVRRVVWANEEIAEVYLAEDANKFFVSPLRQLLPEEQESEIKAGDKVLLMGQYLVIVDDAEDDDNNLSEPEHAELPTPVQLLPQQLGRSGPILYATSQNTARTRTNVYDIGNQDNRSRALPEVFANWMKIVGVEKRPMDRRKVNRRKEKKMVISTFN